MFHNTNEKAVFRESIEASSGDPLGTFESARHLSDRDSRMPGHVGKDNSVPTVVTLQKILSDQPGRTDAQTQSSRYASEITARLGQHGLQCTERE
ncbi:hypothetical protein [Streptomyces subrutilus]|uniref:Uncharacterized protein n=1 Tax=Streptomyces subrutilus TaxID=36818 RepID=A0A1E5PN86_9ACTN|nr:hypothetical protein [Streptomyces subrutilus]OEJ31009.1 hypothetical protein BGK67_06295 [Streptomyces subrutilus]